MRSRVTTILLLLCFARTLNAGVVQTLDGKKYEGDLTLNRDAIVVTSARGTTMAVPLANVRRATFAAAAPAPSRGWVDADVGAAVRTAGRTEPDGELLRMTFAGFGFGSARKRQPRPDAFHFRYQALAGDGQLVMRLRTMTAIRTAKVGLMIRESLDPGAPAAAIYCEEEPIHTARFLARTVPGELYADVADSDRAVLGALWLKVDRHGNRFRGFDSLDGKEWKLVGEQQIPMRPSADVCIGIAAANGLTGTSSEALFDHIEFTAGSVGDAVAATPVMGFVTAAGSVVEARIVAAGEKTFRFAYANGPEQSMPVTDVARLIFSERYPTVAEHITSGKTGVLLIGGDFVEAQIDRVADGQVRINSVLFGLKSFDLRREVAAVAVGDVKPFGAWEIRKRNASCYRTDALQIAENGVTFTDPTLGEIHIPASEITEMKRVGK